jgi:peptide-methionine (S)-S-oxide reductase
MFRELPGVISTAVGYMGGSTENPTYEDVCRGMTGHVEVVQLEYDRETITFEMLLDVFWQGHDPTSLNRQGPDVGTQYRSVIFHHGVDQEASARESKGRLARSGRFRMPIVTAIEPASVFWRAEEYHQRYFEKNGIVGCHIPPPTIDDP